MTDSIMDMARPFFNEGPIDALSRFFGENRDGTRRALEAAIPASIVGVADYASNETNAASLMERFRHGDHPSMEIGDLGSVLVSRTKSEALMRGGEGMLQRVFSGGTTGELIGVISSHSGIGRGGVGKILAFAMPVVLGFIGKRAVAQNMDARGLSKHLGHQRGLAAAMLPSALGGIFNRDQTVDGRDIHVDRSQRLRGSAVKPTAKAAPRRILPWALAVFATLVGLSLLTRRSNHVNRSITEHHAVREPKRPIAQQTPTVQEPAPVTPEPTPSGDAGQISRYLAGNATQPQRFELSEVEFASGSAALDTEDRQVLQDIAQVLSKDDKATVRIEGHADPTGDEVMNQRLSQLRAEEVERYLVSQEVSGDRLSAVGSGEHSKPGQAEEPRRSVDLVIERR